MADHPILFSAPMVRALLDGTKTQTRRALKSQPAGKLLSLLERPIRKEGDLEVLRAWFQAGPGEQTSVEITCPYGKRGDRLWVRESHWFYQDEHDPVTGYTPPVLTREDVEYRADDGTQPHGWRPSIHMPRWASRITLNVTGVSVERLQAISEDGARAEGVDYDPGEGGIFWVPGLGCTSDSAVDSFRQLWSSINGPESWDANPWVWVVEFQRAEA